MIRITVLYNFALKNELYIVSPIKLQANVRKARGMQMDRFC